MSQMTFQYRAIDRAGARTKGVVHAADRNEAYRRLRASGLRPLRIESGRHDRGRRKKVTAKDLAHLTYQFSVLLDARIPIVDGLRSIAEQENNPRLRGVLDDVADQIQAGNSVTNAMSMHRALFGDVYIETVRAAEISGNMIEVLKQLADMLDRQYETSKAVKGALMYPICVIAALSLAVTFLLVFVVPRFAAMFEARGIDLPLPTQVLVAFSGFMTNYWYALLLLIGGTIFCVRAGWKRPQTRQRMDTALHRVPFLRDVLQGLAISRFARVLGITIRSGLSLLDALDMAGRASGRPLLDADARTLREQVKLGGRLSDVVQTCEYLPSFTRRMLAAGEEAAELHRMCDIVARHYEREVSYLTKNVATVIEPLMIIGLAGVVLVIALAIFLPLWNMGALI